MREQRPGMCVFYNSILFELFCCCVSFQARTRLVYEPEFRDFCDTYDIGVLLLFEDLSLPVKKQT